MTSPAFTSILWFVAIIAMIPAVLWLLKRETERRNQGATASVAPSTVPAE